MHTTFYSEALKVRGCLRDVDVGNIKVYLRKIRCKWIELGSIQDRMSKDPAPWAYNQFLIGRAVFKKTL